MLLDRNAAQDLVQRLVGLSRADEMRVSIRQDDTAHLRFARNTPSTNGLAETLTIGVRSTFGTRSGTARGNQLDADSLEGIVRRSEAVARRSPEDPEHMPELAPHAFPDTGAAGDEDLEARLDRMATGAGACIEDALDAGLIAAGFVNVADSLRVIGNSAGLFGYHRETAATFSETVRTKDGTGSGWACSAANTAGGIDFEGCSRTAIEKSRRSAQPQRLEPGDMPAVLEPACVANLVRLLLGDMRARGADEGRSSFAAPGGGTRLGEALFPESIDIRSDPGDPVVPTIPWSDDGLAHRPTHWIEKGRVARLSTSRYWAKKNELTPVAAPPNVIMAGGTKTLAELVAQMERGLLVTNFWYMRGVDPKTLLYTGLTRDGVFQVEDGEIVRPVNNFRWNDSPIRVLKNVLDLSVATRVGGRGGRTRNYVVPALEVSAFGFSSISEAV